jgi:hypothetical protein
MVWRGTSSHHHHHLILIVNKKPRWEGEGVVVDLKDIERGRGEVCGDRSEGFIERSKVYFLEREMIYPKFSKILICNSLFIKCNYRLS